MKYELPDLLALRGNAAIDVGKFTIHALENNLLGRRKSVSSTERERPSNGSRRAQRSTSRSEESFQHPTRQPRNAPQSNLAEADSGFAKFLKEHTSPKHQRVTAGGRVVLVDGDPPIPELKPPLKKAKEDNPQKTDGEASIPSSRSLRNSSSGKTGQSSSASSNANAVAGQPFSVITQEKAATGDAGTYPANGNGDTTPQITAAYPSLQQWQVPLLAPTNYRHQPVPFTSGTYPAFQLAGQETVAMPINPSLSQSFRPDTTTLFPSAAPPFVAQGHILQSVSPQAASLPTAAFQLAGKQGMFTPAVGLSDLPFTTPTAYAVTGLGNLTPYSTMPVMSCPTSLPSYEPDSNTQRSLQDVMKEYQSLSSQLSGLDRYMAINTFELDTETKNNLVEQRKGLVRDLDMARRYKEHLESNNKIPPGGTDPISTLRFQQWAELTNGIGLQYSPWLSYMTPSNPFADYSTLTLPSTQNTFTNTFALQLPQLGYLPQLPNLNTWGEYQYPVQIPQNEQPGLQDQQFVDHVDRNTTISQSRNVSNGPSTCAASSKSKSSWSSSEIGELHRQIEDAAKRGEPVDELFRKLAKLTEQHAIHRGNQNTADRQSATTSADVAKGRARSPLSSAKEGKDSTESGVSKVTLTSGFTKKGSANSGDTENIPKNSRARESLNGSLAAQGQDGARRHGETVASKHTFNGPRHTRDGRLKNVGARTKNRKVLEEVCERQSMMLTPWGTRGDEDLVGSKACSPVISRVNAHGFLPSFDGTSDHRDAFSEHSAILIDIQDDMDFSWKGAAGNRPWYQKAPRQTPDRLEVGRFFLRIAEEERKMINKYRMLQYPGENYISE